MPIEIKELHVKIAVTPPGANSAPGAASPTGGDRKPGAGGDDVVAECVEQVLQILENKRER